MVPRRMPHSFLPVPRLEPVRLGAKIRRLVRGLGPSRLVLDEVAARYRHVLDQRDWASLVKMPGRVLLVEGVLRRHTVDRHDRLEAAFGGALGRARDRAL